jgi:glyoxylase-like metal-dependent hydrolase (beta-lactamase superfamily II)
LGGLGIRISRSRIYKIFSNANPIFDTLAICFNSLVLTNKCVFDRFTSLSPNRNKAYIKESKMKLTVLVDNNTLIDRYFFAEPGIALFIEQGGKRILLDVGYSDIFIKNAQKMNIDLRTLDYVVLSHGHLDHTWGLDPLARLYTESKIEGVPHKRPTVLAHPSTFFSRKFDEMEIGSLISQDKLSIHFPIKRWRHPLQVGQSPGLWSRYNRKPKTLCPA